MTEKPEADNPIADEGVTETPDFNPEDATVDPDGELKRLRAELDEAEKRALRYQADLDNFRRRARRDADEVARYAALPFVEEILEAMDNLNRAIEASHASSDSTGLAEGVRMVAHQIQNSLQNYGCRTIESTGAAFDPNLHQAVQMVPSEVVPANHVAVELRPGYRLHERVIRPSQVIVSTGSATT